MRCLVVMAVLALSGCGTSVTVPALSRHATTSTTATATTTTATTTTTTPIPSHCQARGTGDFSLPDARCTPGVADPRVTQADIDTTICQPGYSKHVRPPDSVTNPEKRASMAAYGDTGSPGDYEYDHLISLELGGAPNDSRNLWPEPGASPNPKDKLEDRLHEDVCHGTITLAAAQQEIAGDWIAAYHRAFGP